MITFINTLSIVLLLVSILYAGRQLNVYLRMRSRLGKLIVPLTPSQSQMKRLKFSLVAFIALLLLVSIRNITSDLGLNASFAMVLAAVIFSYGRFLTKVSELRENGILGSLNEIGYNLIQRYKVEEEGNKSILTFKLRDGRDFVAVVGNGDLDEVVESLKVKKSA